MSRTQNIESRTEEYLAQVEKYEKHPIVVSVLAQDSSFTREIENFYGLSTWLIAVPRAGIAREFDFQEDDPQKNGKYPMDLVKILNGFSEEPFNIGKLSYDSVREDYQRWNNPSRRLKRVVVGMGSLLTGIGGTLGGVIYGLEGGNLEVAIPIGLIGVGSLGVHLWALISNYPKPKGTNNELEEYVKLNDSAERADSFMGEHYKNYFIKKALATITN